MKFNTAGWILVGIILAASFGPGAMTRDEMTDNIVDDLISLTMMPPSWQHQMRVYVDDDSNNIVDK